MTAPRGDPHQRHTVHKHRDGDNSCWNLQPRMQMRSLHRPWQLSTTSTPQESWGYSYLASAHHLAPILRTPAAVIHTHMPPGPLSTIALQWSRPLGVMHPPALCGSTGTLSRLLPIDRKNRVLRQRGAAVTLIESVPCLPAPLVQEWSLCKNFNMKRKSVRGQSACGLRKRFGSGCAGRMSFECAGRMSFVGGTRKHVNVHYICYGFRGSTSWEALIWLARILELGFQFVQD